MEEDEIKCYKVLKVLRNSNRRVSCTVTGPAQIEYKEGEWNMARGTLRKEDMDICVFTSLEKAMMFSNAYRGRYNYCDFEVWECIGRVPHAPGKFVSPRTLSDAGRKGLKSLSKWFTSLTVSGTFPPGTAMVKELMLLERIKNE